MSKLHFRSLFDETDAEGEIQVRQSQSAGIVLRPYQVETVEAVFEEWESVQSTLACLPTGCGKSVIFSEVMRRWVEQ